jgi:hypothetical protein
MKSRFPIAALWICILAFAYGLFHLFQLRFEVGDVYPPYSSLRADPLGTKAFYESLDRLPDISPWRHFQLFSKITTLHDTTYLYLAEPSEDHDPTERDAAQQLERLISDHGRVVFTFEPDVTDPKLTPAQDDEPTQAGKDEKRAEPVPKPDDKSKDSIKAGKKKPPSPGNDETIASTELISLNERWGLALGFDALPTDKDKKPQSVTARRASTDALPETISWHSGLYFKDLAPAWRAIYERDGHPVLIERAFGQGTIVMATDSYFVSNESLRRERHAALLAWLVGPSHSVLFDEAHLGVQEDPGLASLARKYRLHGLFAALVVLAALYIWKSGVSFIPPFESDTGHGGLVTGKDSSAGFVNLLRRNIPAGELLNVCLSEWRKTYPAGQSRSAARLQQVEAIVRDQQALPARDRRPLQTYQVICRILDKRGDVKRDTQNVI